MSDKMGRPPLPKGQAKYNQIGVRLNPKEDKGLVQIANEAGQTKSEAARMAVNQEVKGPPIWVKTDKWKLTDLHEQTIEFRLRKNVPQGVRVLEGTGKMLVRENARGEIAVDIFADQSGTPYSRVTFRIWLPKEAVEAIELNPNSERAKFRLLG